MPKKIRPALFGFSHLPWRWVLLPEVAEIIGASPDDVVTRYIGLSRNWPTLCVTGGEEIFPIEMLAKGFDLLYVPFGWARDVLEAHQLGTYRVTRVVHMHTHDPAEVCPEGTIGGCIFDGTYFHAPVGLTIDGKPVWTYAECEHTHGIQVARVYRTCTEVQCTVSGHRCGPYLIQFCRRCGVNLSEKRVK